MSCDFVGTIQVLVELLGVGLAAVAVNPVILIWKLAQMDFLTIRGRRYNDQLASSVVQWKAGLVKAGAKLHEVNRAPFVARIAERNRQWQKEGYWRPGLIDEIEKLR